MNVRPNGKVLAGGKFSALKVISKNNIARQDVVAGDLYDLIKGSKNEKNICDFGVTFSRRDWLRSSAISNQNGTSESDYAIYGRPDCPL